MIVIVLVLVLCLYFVLQGDVFSDTLTAETGTLANGSA